MIAVKPVQIHRLDPRSKPVSVPLELVQCIVPRPGLGPVRVGKRRFEPG